MKRKRKKRKEKRDGSKSPKSPKSSARHTRILTRSTGLSLAETGDKRIAVWTDYPEFGLAALGSIIFERGWIKPLEIRPAQTIPIRISPFKYLDLVQPSQPSQPSRVRDFGGTGGLDYSGP